MFIFTITLVKQEDGRYFGNIRDANRNRFLDKHGNHLECVLKTKDECCECLISQMKEEGYL